MSMESRKLALVQRILDVDSADDLKALEKAVEDVRESARARQLIIGYRPSGTPVLKQRFLDRLRHTLQDVEHNEYLPLSTFERHAADW